jgi:signal transduction histidine kinase
VSSTNGASADLGRGSSDARDESLDPRAEAAEQSEAIDRLISTVSHELRTPLSVIVGYAELLGARDDEETRREAPIRIKEAAERLSSVVENILTVSSLDSGSLFLELVPVDLEDAVAETIARFERDETGHSFASNSMSPEGWPVVTADPVELGRILANLVSNACKYSPGGGEIVVRADRRDGSAVVSVSDQGPGIGEEEQERAFERVSRLDGPVQRGTRGSGLGLYITRALVELHGGSIWVESEPGRGSTFTFTVPLASEPA